MKFSEFSYERPDLDEVKESFQNALEEFRKADSAEQQINALETINDVRLSVSTLSNLAHIRHTIDTTDEYWEEENDYFDQVSPVLEDLSRELYKALLDSPYQSELKERYGSVLFQKARKKIQSFSSDILDLRKSENQLKSRYQKLLASARIPFKGEERNLSGLRPFQKSEDRSVRKKASEAKWGFFEENAEELDDIFDELVSLRHNMARKLDYDNFVEMGYDRMKRMGYDRSKVTTFRSQVKQHIVPLASRLKEQQRERLSLNRLTYYDEPFQFPEGSPEPKGNPEWIVKQARDMYEELSPETDEFFEFMVENELMDLTNKKGKAGGGYCTFLPDYEAPFIFSNFNGTEGDVRVLTHEGGHAFQMYQSRKFDLPENHHPTSEAAEIHSMSMELFTWPWMEQFFQEDTQKFKFSQLTGAIDLIPYCVAVDEFQHRIYENPDMTPEERHGTWKELEETYLPHKNYEDNTHLQEGRYWQKQRHIYCWPFYYIDYALAQVCAFQFWKRAQTDREGAWNDYLSICQAGGSITFLDQVEMANLDSPFEKGTVNSAVEVVRDWLNGQADQIE